MDTEHTCPQGWDLTQLLAYVEGDLEEAARAQVEQHVLACPFCAEELESLQRMSGLLTQRPEAFHPDEDELYRFVSQGADPSGKIATHLESCDGCNLDVALLREMISQPAAGVQKLSGMPQTLLERLGQSAVPQAQWTLSRLLSALEGLFALPFRMPVLALGSAAAVLIIVAVCLPLWRSFQIKQHVGEFRGLERGRIASKMKDLKQRDELQAHRDRSQNLLEKPMGQVYPRADYARPAEPPSQAPAIAPPAPLPEQSTDLRDIKSEAPSPAEKAAPAKEAAGRLKPSPAAPAATLEAAPESVQPGRAIVPDLKPQEQAREKERQEKLLPETKRSALGMSAPRSAPHAYHREAKKDVAGIANQPAKGLALPVPVTVSITDAQARPLPWIEVRLPRDLEYRFRLLSPGDRESDAGEAKTTSSEVRLTDEKATQGVQLRVEIRIFPSDGVYDVDCKLFDAASGREMASVVAVRKNREEVPGAVNEALRRLLEHQ